MAHKIEDEQHFQTRCHVKGRLCSIILDRRNCSNIASTRLVSKLNLEILEYNQVKIPFSIGKYKDVVYCEVKPMETCHILLGRPWHIANEALLLGRTLYFSHEGGMITLDPLPLDAAYEDQRKLREKIEQERKEIERKEKELREKEAKERKDILVTNATNVFSSVCFHVQEFGKRVDIIPNAPLFVQPNFTSPSQRDNENSHHTNVIQSDLLHIPSPFKKVLNSRTNSFQEGGDDVTQGGAPHDQNKGVWATPRNTRECLALLREHDKAKIEYVKLVFDPGGIKVKINKIIRVARD